jgi:hypothetical protein
MILICDCSLLFQCIERWLMHVVAYFNRSRRFTKSALGALTRPFLFMLRLRFFDFFVKMWRLKAFWKVILPVPVTLNLFLALEFVLTFGIFCQVLLLYPAGGSAQAEHLWGRLGNVAFVSSGNQQKLRLKPMFQNGAQRYVF